MVGGVGNRGGEGKADRFSWLTNPHIRSALLALGYWLAVASGI